MSAPATAAFLTIGDVARHFGLQMWQIRRLYERRLLPEPPRIGSYRAVPAMDLPAIEAALRRCRYLPGDEEESARA